ncbi:pitrilysin family protein [Mucilaginibacter sp. SG564]|uniref:M16 family metallopeptidase n=1 Tax=Mucilaginibacter sp. SG564 TaxID=2587022 RepID=UPI00155603D9|nr:insulinase family protein [Mucilaginibacter sp. SG564]NOW96007.1 zinc protease [Mucilaginibacter sp. SG564]
MKIIKQLIILPMLSALTPFGLYAQKSILPQAALPLDPAVRIGRLPNGFTYFIRHNGEPQKRVIFYLVNKAGSVLENDNQRGLAHFMEHMSFNGTKHFPKNELIDYLQRSGIRFGADLNAYTAFDETVYQLPVPSDRPELLQGAFAIMRDWAQEATLDPAEIEKERGVVLEEKRLGKGAGERMRQLYWPVMLNNSRYSSRMPIGQDTVLNNFKPEAIRSFYHDWYRPDLQALIVVGDINVTEVEQKIKKEFSSLKNPLKERSRLNYTIPLTGKNQFVKVTDKEMPSTVAEVVIKHKAPELKTIADYRKAVMQALFNQMLAARIAEISRHADVPFVVAGASISPLMGGLDSFDLNVEAKPGSLQAAVKTVWREAVRLQRFGFTGGELNRAKTEYLSGMESMVREKNKTNSENYVREYQEYFLKGIAAPGIDAEYRLTKEDLQSISLAELNDLARVYIAKANRDIILMAPEKDKNNLPDEKTATGWLAEVDLEHLAPYEDKLNSKPLLSVVPVAGQIRDEKFDKALGITTLTLSNGIKVMLKPTTFKNDAILFSGFAPGGTSLFSDQDFPSAANAAAIVASGGAGNYDATELGKFMQGKQASVSPFIDENYEGINGRTGSKDMETALQLVYAYFTEPRKDSTIFNSIIARSKAALANRADDPGSVFSDTTKAILGNYNIRRTGPTIAKLEQVDLNKAFETYKISFSNAADFKFIFTGSFDVEHIKPLLEKYLGSLPVSGVHRQFKDLGIHIPPGKIEKTVFKGSEPKSTVLLVFSGDYDFSQENNVRMDALKEVLEIRLLERLREEESGVYTPSAFVNLTKIPKPRYSFVVQFGCAPQNVEKLVSSTLDEIDKIKSTGPPQINVDKWRAEEKTALEPQLKTNGFWLTYISRQIQNQESLDQVNRYNEFINKVTPADLKTMSTRYLGGENYIKLILKPEGN